MRTTDIDLQWARSGKKNIYAVRWSTDQARIVKTKKRAHELIGIWKKWKVRQGWVVLGNVSTGFIAARDGERQACALRIYDPSSLALVE